MRALVFLSLIVSLQVLANNNIPQPVINALSGLFPHHKPNTTYIEVGDLTGDRVEDVATLLGDPGYNIYDEKDSQIKVAVIAGTKGGGYQLFALSPELPRDPNILYFLQIQKQSLILKTSGRGWTRDYQFKMRDKELVLIGEESASFGAIEENKPYIRESINYITGTAVYSEKSKAGYKEKRGNFKKRNLVRLAEFDLTKETFSAEPDVVNYPQH